MLRDTPPEDFEPQIFITVEFSVGSLQVEFSSVKIWKDQSKVWSQDIT